MYRSHFLSHYPSVLLFLCCVIFGSFLYGQTENFTQQLTSFLPQNTFFLASVESPEETLKHWKQTAPGKVLEHPQIQAFIEDLWDQAWKSDSAIVPPKEKNLLNLVWQSFSLADQGMALVALSRPEERDPKYTPDLLWIARASSAPKIQAFSDLLVNGLLDGDRELLEKQNMNGLEFYELLFSANAGFGPYFACTKNYFIAGTSLNTFLEVLSALSSQTAVNNNLRQDPLFLQAEKEVAFSSESPFFLYFNLERCLQKETESGPSSLISENQQEAIATLKNLYYAQSQFQSSAFKDRDLDGTGEYGYFTELSGIHPVPRGTEQGSVLEYPLMTAEIGESSRQNEGLGIHHGYHFAIYLASYPYAVIENGESVSPASETPDNLASEEFEQINAQENRWTCYAWPVEKEKTGNLCFVINQSGTVYFSDNANYNNKLIPPPEACYPTDYREEAQNLIGDIYSNESCCDGFNWKAYEESTSADSAPFTSLIEEFLRDSFSRFMGLDQFQFLAASFQYKENKLQDKIVYQFKDSVRMIQLWGKTENSLKSLDLCPENSVLYGSVSLNLEEMKGWIKEVLLSEEGDPIVHEMKEKFLEELASLLGEEISFFGELPVWGILPKGAVLIPLANSQKFFEMLQNVFKEGRYVLKNADYSGHRFYYLEPKEVWFVEPFLVSFTYIQGHLVVSYNPEGIKSVIHTSQNQQRSLRSSAKWRKFSESISGKPQGIFFSDNHQILIALYEIGLQLLLLIRPQWAVQLPKTSEVVAPFTFSGTTLHVQSNQIQISNTGDALGPASMSYTYFQLGLLAIFYNLVAEKPSLKKNENAVVGILRSLSTSQSQFQSATVKDRDVDGVGEYGYFTELSGTHPVPVGDSQGSPVSPSFLNQAYGSSSSQSSGIVSKSGYYFLIYLPSTQEAIRENGLPVPPVSLNTEGSEKDQESVNLQEGYWICYAWPMVKGETGNRCFVINQSNELYFSENAPYIGLDKIPSPEACFSTYSAYREIKRLMGSISNDSTEPAVDGFIWQYYQE